MVEKCYDKFYVKLFLGDELGGAGKKSLKNKNFNEKQSGNSVDFLGGEPGEIVCRSVKTKKQTKNNCRKTCKNTERNIQRNPEN